MWIFSHTSLSLRRKSTLKATASDPLLCCHWLFDFWINASSFGSHYCCSSPLMMLGSLVKKARKAFLKCFFYAIVQIWLSGWTSVDPIIKSYKQNPRGIKNVGSDFVLCFFCCCFFVAWSTLSALCNLTLALRHLHLALSLTTFLYHVLNSKTKNNRTTNCQLWANNLTFTGQIGQILYYLNKVFNNKALHQNPLQQLYGKSDHNYINI